MSARFRVVDAGLQEGRYNIALDQAMLELHQTGAIPDSVRFIHFQPSALVGRRRHARVRPSSLPEPPADPSLRLS